MFFKRYTDPGAQLYRWAEPERWETASPPGASPRQLWQADVYNGFAFGTGFNPFVAFVAGQGLGHAKNPHLRWRHLVRFDAVGQQGWDRAIDFETALHRQSFRERGVAGTLADSVFDSFAIPAFGGGYTAGRYLGIPLWGVLRLANALGGLRRNPGFGATRTLAGNAVGAAVGLVVGLVTTVGPWGGLIVPRLVAGAVEVLCGLLGAALGALVGLRHLGALPGMPQRGMPPPPTRPINVCLCPAGI